MTDPQEALQTPETPRLTEIGGESLVILTRLELERVFSSLRTGEIQHRDLTILLMYVSRADWRTGRTRYKADMAAEQLGVTRSLIYQSLKRLSKALLLVSIKDKTTGETLKLVNPHLMKCGGSRNRPYLLKVFEESVNLLPPAAT